MIKRFRSEMVLVTMPSLSGLQQKEGSMVHTITPVLSANTGKW